MARSDKDRRSIEERRKVHDLDYFSAGGVERRRWKEQRKEPERRTGWIRVDRWTSVCLKYIKSLKIFDS
jgi:hypothetical protein